MQYGVKFISIREGVERPEAEQDFKTAKDAIEFVDAVERNGWILTAILRDGVTIDEDQLRKDGQQTPPSVTQ